MRPLRPRALNHSQPPRLLKRELVDIEMAAAGISTFHNTPFDLSTLTDVTAIHITKVAAETFSGLRTELGKWIDPPSPLSLQHFRSDTERAILDGPNCFGARLSAAEPGETVRTLLADINSKLTGGRSRLRTGSISLHPDSAGNRVIFPSHSLINPQFDLLASIFSRKILVNAIADATIILVAILNIHAFTNGNGRLARFLFNYTLRRGGMSPRVYVPLYEIGVRSSGGFLVALRQAEIFGRWAPLIDFIEEALAIHGRLG